jgi:hypothetical protein
VQPVDSDTSTVDITAVDSAAVMLDLWPWMAHPDDQAGRERLTAYLWAKILAQSGQPIPEFMAQRLAEAAEIGVGRDLDDALPGGCIAGDVLLVLLEFAANQVDGAGQDRGFHVVSECYAKAEDGHGHRFRAGRDTVKKHWARYRNVAHLWAAHLILVREAEQSGDQSEAAVTDGKLLAGIACALRGRAAEQFLPTGESVLPPGALRIVGAPIVRLAPTYLTAAMQTALASFTPRNKI